MSGKGRFLLIPSHLFSSSFILLLLIACAPVEQPYVQSSKEPMMRTGIFETADGTPLPFRKWLPEDAPQAVVVALHGFNDYSNAFEGAGEFLAQSDIAVYAYDQRGFGRAPLTGIWGGERNYVSDLAQWVRYLSAHYPHTPVYVLGESMGGAIVISALADKDFPAVAGAVLVSPAVWGGDTINPLYRVAVIISAYTFPYYELTGQGLKIQASDNIEMLRAMSRDPLVIKSTRVDAVYGIVNLMDDAFHRIGKVTRPVLFLYGLNDQVIPPSAMEEALEKFPNGVACIRYPEGYHMLLRDLNGLKTVADIRNWLLKRPNYEKISNCLLTINRK